jgi:uncharacterized protein (TIGR01244 family)
MRGGALRVLFGQAALCFTVWAGGVSAPGISNFHQVNEHIYRGAQPRDDGWAGLTRYGIKTVIDLRPESEHSCKTEKRLVEAAGMRYINVPFSEIHGPSDGNISKVLALLNESGGAVFLHCRRGADRTGTVIACYRIAHDGWTNQKALDEAKSHGMSWLEFGMQHYVLGFHASSPANAASSGLTQSAEPEPGTLN